MQKLSLFFILALVLVLSFGCLGQKTAGFPVVVQDTNSDKNYNAVVNNLDDLGIAKSGDTVKVNYTGRFTDGKVFDSSLLAGRGPLEFTIDDGTMIKGFNEAVKGMKKGETKTITLAPEDAYGATDPSKVITLNKSQFADFDSLIVGMMVSAGNFSGKVISKNDQNAVVDFNPEMAGKTLVFEITLVEVSN